MKEIVPSMDSNLTFSLIKMMDSFFEPFVPRDVSSFRVHHLFTGIYRHQTDRRADRRTNRGTDRHTDRLTHRRRTVRENAVIK